MGFLSWRAARLSWPAKCDAAFGVCVRARDVFCVCVLCAVWSWLFAPVAFVASTHSYSYTRAQCTVVFWPVVLLFRPRDGRLLCAAANRFGRQDDESELMSHKWFSGISWVRTCHLTRPCHAAILLTSHGQPCMRFTSILRASCHVARRCWQDTLRTQKAPFIPSISKNYDRTIARLQSKQLSPAEEKSLVAVRADVVCCGAGPHVCCRHVWHEEAWFVGWVGSFIRCDLVLAAARRVCVTISTSSRRT